MKNKMNIRMTALHFVLLMIIPAFMHGQSDKEVMSKYLKKLNPAQANKAIQKYRMTAIYVNRDLYGNFTGKFKVQGDYTRGLENSMVLWNNVSIAASNDFEKPFQQGNKQEYMENMKYVPSQKMMNAESFGNFPPTPEAVFARNLVWDMMMIEYFAWDFCDSLVLNKTFHIPHAGGSFQMADIGTFNHTDIQLCWTGISAVNGELCAVIEYRALDNKIELSMPGFKSKGTEQYWGTTWISLKTHSVEGAVLYGGTIQEMEIQGMPDKMVAKTIRDLWVDKIQ
jgi:hypothetical protein